MERASLESQLGTAPCAVEDMEEIFWLRESDDYQSKIALGNALAAQYRFKDAIAAYQDASHIRGDDWTLYHRLAGAYLTIRRFAEAKANYDRCLALGAGERSVAFSLGVWNYLSGCWQAAADWFAKCLPCEDELAIAVIYLHTLSCYRAGLEPELLSHYHTGMEVGHHTAYELAVRVFCGDCPWEDAVGQAKEEDDLNTVIVLYGICVYMEYTGRWEKGELLRKELLERDSCWPCIPYLAAWNDRINGR